MKKLWVLSALSLLMAVVPAQPVASAEKSYTMKVAHAGFPGTVQDGAAQRFAEQVEKMSNGVIKKQVFPSSQLGNNQQMNQGIVSGVIEALVQPPGFLAPNIPIFGFLEAPYLFNDPKSAVKVMNSKPVFDILDKAATAKGYKLIMLFGTGMKEILTIYPVKSIEDLKGKKFRCFETPIAINNFKSWGASGIPMALSEVYTALQQGTVDGSDNTIEFFAAMKHYEAAPYLSFTNHGISANTITVSKIWFDKLPMDLQNIVVKTGQGIVEETVALQKMINDKALETMKGKGVKVHEFTTQEMNTLKEKSRMVYDAAKKDIPGVEEFYKILQEQSRK